MTGSPSIWVLAVRQRKMDFCSPRNQTSFLPKLNFHRKGAKSAKGAGFSLAAERDGKRKGPPEKSDQVDL